MEEQQVTQFAGMLQNALNSGMVDEAIQALQYMDQYDVEIQLVLTPAQNTSQYPAQGYENQDYYQQTYAQTGYAQTYAQTGYAQTYAQTGYAQGNDSQAADWVYDQASNQYYNRTTGQYYTN